MGNLWGILEDPWFPRQAGVKACQHHQRKHVIQVLRGEIGINQSRVWGRSLSQSHSRSQSRSRNRNQELGRSMSILLPCKREFYLNVSPLSITGLSYSLFLSLPSGDGSTENIHSNKNLIPSLQFSVSNQTVQAVRLFVRYLVGRSICFLLSTNIIAERWKSSILWNMLEQGSSRKICDSFVLSKKSVSIKTNSFLFK